MINVYCNHINKIERDEKKMKEYKQLGAYGLVISEGKILLIKKSGGPYDGKLDLPGGNNRILRKTCNCIKKGTNGGSWNRSS